MGAVRESIQPGRSTYQTMLVMGLYTLLVLGPTLFLGVRSFQAAYHNPMDLLGLALPVGRRSGLLLNSVGLALGVGLTCSLLGWLAAVRLWSRHSRYTWLVVLAAIPLSALPVYIYALTWFSGVGQLNRLLEFLDLPQGAQAGYFSVLLVETIAYTPLAAALAWLGLRSIHPELVESARLARPDMRCLLNVIFPLSIPTLWCAGAIIFLLCLMDYSVPSLLQVQVYPMEIFADFSAVHSPERAFMLSIPMIAVATVGLFTLLKPLRSLVVSATFQNQAWRAPADWPFWFENLLKVGTAFLLISICLPFIMLLTASGSPDRALGSWLDAGQEVWTSLRTAWLVVLICLPLAALVGSELLSPGRFLWVKWVLVLTPLALPASLIGIGLIPITQTMALRQPPLNLLPPVLASLARCAPFAVLIFVAQMRRQDTLLLDAARVLQRSGWRRLVWVKLPLIAVGLLVAAGLVFALTLGELGATLMVIPPGQATVSMRLYNYLHYGASDVVAGLSLFMAGAVIAVYAVVIFIAWVGWRRFAAGSAER